MTNKHYSTHHRSLHWFIGYGIALIAIAVSFSAWSFIADRWATGRYNSIIAAAAGEIDAFSPYEQGRVDVADRRLLGDILSQPGHEEVQDWKLVQRYSIQIPALKITAPVLVPSPIYWQFHEWELLEKQMQVGLKFGTVTYPHSSPVGRPGTLYVAGHSSPPSELVAENPFDHVFASLPSVKVGDSIELRDWQTTYVYQVQGTEIVEPSETSILVQQHDKTLLKLITCYPVGTSKQRIVVTAKFVGKKGA